MINLARYYNQCPDKQNDKENEKENNNHSNFIPRKDSRLLFKPSKDQNLSEQNIQPIRKGSIVSKFLKKDKFPQTIKDSCSQFIRKNYQTQNLDLYKSMCLIKTDFLRKHSIAPHARSKMVDWMIEVLSSYEMSQEAFFKSVWIMDSYLQFKSASESARELHLIGITSLFISCKYEQVHPIKLQTICSKICRKRFTSREIQQKQSDILLNLNFKLQIPTIYTCSSHIQLLICKQFEPCTAKYLRDVVLYLAKMTLFDYELAQQNHLSVSASVIFIGLKTVEQVQPSTKPQQKLKYICQKMKISETHILQVSQKILSLAKNFNSFYPELRNLKKFNSFRLKKQNQ